MVEKILNADRYRSRKFLGAVFVEAFASMVVVVLGAVKVIAFTFGLVSTVPLMPVLWWWAAVSSGVLSLYGTTEALNSIAKRGGGS